MRNFQAKTKKCVSQTQGLNVLMLLQPKYIKRAHINSKFPLDIGSYTLHSIRKLETPY